MKNVPFSNCFSPVVSQLENNSSQWLGRLPSSPGEIMVGQTFVTPSSGKVGSINVYSEMIQNNGHVTITVHQFDELLHQWGPVLGTAVLDVKKQSHPDWLQFEIPEVKLEKNTCYGFRLKSEDALVAVSEVAWGNNNKGLKGEEWSAKNNEADGHYYNFFSLVFQVGLRA